MWFYITTAQSYEKHFLLVLWITSINYYNAYRLPTISLCFIVYFVINEHIYFCVNLRIHIGEVIKEFKLRVDGFIDIVIYNQELGKIEKQNYEYHAELRNYDKIKTDNKIIELKKLIRYLDSAEISTEFHDDIFITYVDRVIVYSRTRIGFQLKCGLTLQEELCLGTK